MALALRLRGWRPQRQQRSDRTLLGRSRPGAAATARQGALGPCAFPHVAPDALSLSVSLSVPLHPKHTLRAHCGARAEHSTATPNAHRGAGRPIRPLRGRASAATPWGPQRLPKSNISVPLRPSESLSLPFPSIIEPPFVLALRSPLSGSTEPEGQPGQPGHRGPRAPTDRRGQTGPAVAKPRSNRGTRLNKAQQGQTRQSQRGKQDELEANGGPGRPQDPEECNATR
jgi:hypothetical protein